MTTRRPALRLDHEGVEIRGRLCIAGDGEKIDADEGVPARAPIITTNVSRV